MVAVFPSLQRHYALSPRHHPALILCAIQPECLGATYIQLDPSPWHSENNRQGNPPLCSAPLDSDNLRESSLGHLWSHQVRAGKASTRLRGGQPAAFYSPFLLPLSPSAQQGPCGTESFILSIKEKLQTRTGALPLLPWGRISEPSLLGSCPHPILLIKPGPRAVWEVPYSVPGLHALPTLPLPVDLATWASQYVPAAQLRGLGLTADHWSPRSDDPPTTRLQGVVGRDV